MKKDFKFIPEFPFYMLNSEGVIKSFTHVACMYG